MGFAAQVKDELCRQLPEGENQRLALCYGLLLFGKTFSAEEILFQTDRQEICACLEELLRTLFSLSPQVRSQTQAGKEFTLCRLAGEDAARVFAHFGHRPEEVSLRIHLPGEEESVLLSFLKGAYLACGSVINPERAYHLEFTVPYHNLGGDLETLLKLVGFPAKRTTRRGLQVVYCKESEAIEDFLTTLGATGSSLALMQIKVYKDVRNNANRRTNFETANIDKTVNAAIAQVRDIDYIFAHKGEDYLPVPLREVAIARRDNPEMSLRELGEILPERATRSAVNHRLGKISKIAEELRAQGKGEEDL